MIERPILFSAPEVRAILAGHKTQTRRVVKITHRTPGLAACLEPHDPAEVRRDTAAELCPYGIPGDRLWVRETWHSSPHFTCLYRAEYADGAVLPKVVAHGGWRPSIHMPRWASRITLTITDVRVERLQDISEGDAKSEGPSQHQDWPKQYYATWRYAFRDLWESIHGDDSWKANPWVWAITFRTTEDRT